MQAISSTAFPFGSRPLQEKPRTGGASHCLPLLLNLRVKVQTEDKDIVQPVHAAGTFEYSERFLLSFPLSGGGCLCSPQPTFSPSVFSHFSFRHLSHLPTVLSLFSLLIFCISFWLICCKLT